MTRATPNELAQAPLAENPTLSSDENSEQASGCVPRPCSPLSVSSEEQENPCNEELNEIVWLLDSIVTNNKVSLNIRTACANSAFEIVESIPEKDRPSLVLQYP